MMKLCGKTLEKLREIINGDNNPGHYRKGPQLVRFFNELGFSDVYGQGFPSRWVYTDEKLKQINGTPTLDQCLRNAFAVNNFIGQINELDSLVAEFNQYIGFDKWAVRRENDRIYFEKLDKVIIENPRTSNVDLKEVDFLRREIITDVPSLGLDPQVTETVERRLKETADCVNHQSALAAVILIGGILEGILLGTALSYPEQFSKTSGAPRDKDTGKVFQFQKWTLSNLIDVATELGILKQDVKKFSHTVREFRNYIHPYEQLASHFYPEKQTALICFQVLMAAIVQIGEYRKCSWQYKETKNEATDRFTFSKEV